MALIVFCLKNKLPETTSGDYKKNRQNAVSCWEKACHKRNQEFLRTNMDQRQAPADNSIFFGSLAMTWKWYWSHSLEGLSKTLDIQVIHGLAFRRSLSTILMSSETMNKVFGPEEQPKSAMARLLDEFRNHEQCFFFFFWVQVLNIANGSSSVTLKLIEKLEGIIDLFPQCQ